MTAALGFVLIPVAILGLLAVICDALLCVSDGWAIRRRRAARAHYRAALLEMLREE